MSPWDALWLYLFVGSVVALCVEVGSCEISGNRLLPLLALALTCCGPGPCGGDSRRLWAAGGGKTCEQSGF